MNRFKFYYSDQMSNITGLAKSNDGEWVEYKDFLKLYNAVKEVMSLYRLCGSVDVKMRRIYSILKEVVDDLGEMI